MLLFLIFHDAESVFFRLLKLQASFQEVMSSMSEIVATIDDLMHDEGQLALVRYVVGRVMLQI